MKEQREVFFEKTRREMVREEVRFAEGSQRKLRRLHGQARLGIQVQEDTEEE